MTTLPMIRRWGLLFAMAIGLASVGLAANKAEAEIPLTEAGKKLETQYADQLKTLQAEIAKVLPTINEQKNLEFQRAREAVKKAAAEVKAAQQPLSKIKTAKASVDHAKDKWIHGAEKDMAKADAALKKATSDAELEAAKKELAKAQADKEAGVKALKERQDVLDKARAEEPKLIQADKDANAALALAQANELNAAKAMLADVKNILSSDKLDSRLVTCAVLANATPRGLAEFSQQGGERASLVTKLLTNPDLMKQMLEAGGARNGKYCQAMQIYADIQKASAHVSKGVLQRLALGTSLEYAEPVAQRNAVTETNAPAFIDPVKRYLHYEKAYLNSELDPAFKDMTAWECRQIVNSNAPDHILAWGREMLRNYRPDHILNQDYGWRYSGAVRTDVAYRHSQEYTDTDSLQFFQNIIKNGGICGRRAFFGSFIVKCFGLPSVERPQVGHAALARWTPGGWVINFGASWGNSLSKGVLGLTDADFLLETQMQKCPADHIKALRAQCVGDALGEAKYNGYKEGSGGLWNVLALFEKRVIAAEAKSVQLAALGTELGEANESAEAKAKAVGKATVTDADKKIIIAPDGVITIPAAACSGAQIMQSFLGGQQMLCNGAFSCAINTSKAGTYALTARVVTVHDPLHLQLTPNKDKSPIDMTIPYTCGLWQKTAPVTITLIQGQNTLSFSKPASCFSIKEFTLTPVK